MTKEIMIKEPLNVNEVFTDEGLDKVLKKIEEKAMSHVPDIETEKGRKDIASLAYKISRSKTLIDKAGKEMVSEWKKKAKRIDGYRKKARDFLDDLRDKVRQPLTEWEAEQERIRLEEERKEKEKIEKRVEALYEVGCVKSFLTVSSMSDEEFETFLAEKKAEYETEQKRLAEEAEKKRLEKERLEKIRKEQEAEAARLEKIRIDAERKAREAMEAIEAERKKIEAEKRALEAAKQAEREAAERAKARAREKARQETLRPDKEKLTEWVESLGKIPMLELSTEDGKRCFDIIAEKVALMVDDALLFIKEL